LSLPQDIYIFFRRCRYYLQLRGLVQVTNEGMRKQVFDIWYQIGKYWYGRVIAEWAGNIEWPTL